MHKIRIRNIVLIGVLLLLSACSTTRRDGPPQFNVDISKIPDATPKVEKFSKYGNLSSYRVFGKTYYVMKSNKNYHEQGIASWYGTKFHAQRTSNGERYNMLAMTAAHKTLPLPTYLQVTNLRNGKKIIVRVNDRGPFEGSRIIDLSYVAAKKLGMLGHGTTYVDLRAIDPTKYDKNTFDRSIHTQDFYLAQNGVHIPTSHKVSNVRHIQHYAKSSQKSTMYLQVGAYKNKVLAENMKKRVGKLVSLPIKITQMNNHKKLYRVQIGPVEDVATANNITKKLKAMGLKVA